jgi:cysteine desulfurase
MPAHRRTYLDHAATSPLTTAAREAMQRALDAARGNPSSLHREGQAARAVVEEARSEVAEALGVAADEVVFTGSGTEADNLALRGTLWLADRTGRPHLVTSAVEHEAVLRTARWLERRGDAEVTVVAPRPDGVVDAAALVRALRPGTRLVSLMMVNNETGAIQPVEEVGRACRDRGVTFHVDAVQALGRLPVRTADLPADLLTLSAHKVGGPAGCGVLCVRRGLKLQPVLTGGGQESGLRPGTENAAVIAGAARAIALAARGQEERAAGLRALTLRLEAGLLALPDVAINGSREGRAPGIVNASFEGAEATALLHALDLAGHATSTGSACAAGSAAPSHVLQAMGLPDGRVRSALRLSLGPDTSAAEIDGLLEALPGILASTRTHVAS